VSAKPSSPTSRPAFYICSIWGSCFSKNSTYHYPRELRRVDDDATADVPEPASPGDENEGGEEFDVDDSDLKENDSILECLTDYCF
jgi:hypothetical protein